MTTRTPNAGGAEVVDEDRQDSEARECCQSLDDGARPERGVQCTQRAMGVGLGEARFPPRLTTRTSYSQGQRRVASATDSTAQPKMKATP